MSEVKDDIICM